MDGAATLPAATKRPIAGALNAHKGERPGAKLSLATHGAQWQGGHKFSESQETEMAYERLDEALRQLKADRERAEATENQRKKASAEASIRFARIKTAEIAPIFKEVVARIMAEGFFGEMVEEQNDASAPDVNLSEDEEFSRQGRLQVRCGLIEINIRAHLEGR
jgi:hypothetical protein